MNNEYMTKDLGLAATLVINDLRLVSVDNKNGICWFRFGDKSKCDELANNYFFGKVLVNARDFQEALKRLKNLIYRQ